MAKALPDNAPLAFKMKMTGLGAATQQDVKEWSQFMLDKGIETMNMMVPDKPSEEPNEPDEGPDVEIHPSYPSTISTEDRSYSSVLVAYDELSNNRMTYQERYDLCVRLLSLRSHRDILFRKCLISTGTMIIVYQSEDLFLGVNLESFDGMNVMGKAKVYVRDVLATTTIQSDVRIFLAKKRSRAGEFL